MNPPAHTPLPRDPAQPATGYVPPGWPERVRPAGVPGWEQSAIAYLFDCCPPDFRAYRVLRNHPLVLAQFARHFVDGQHETTRRGLAEIRSNLRRLVGPEVVESAAQAWLEQDAQLARTRRAVGLVDQALRGVVFRAKL